METIRNLPDGTVIDYCRHEVRASTLPEDTRHIGPLLGNDDLKFVLDARGCMHDFTASPAWPPPRIVWTGRRHNQRIDRYNSNQFEYGFFDLRLADEDKLPAVTAWHQRLHPTEGWVETIIERKGGMRETVTTFLCLDRNLIACRRTYENLPDGIRPLALATHTFCQTEAGAIPFRTTWEPLPMLANAAGARFSADGHVVYRGEMALFSDHSCAGSFSGNALTLSIPLGQDGTATMYLAMEDDLGDNPQLVTVCDGPWMPHGVREVHRENEERAATRTAPDPAEEIAKTRLHVVSAGFDGLLAAQQTAWAAYSARYRVVLPESEALLAAALRGAIYHVRCGYSHYCWGSSPFNQSWGAHYAWNERYPVEGLMAWGVDDMPVRVMEWRRRILPFLSLRAAARGAFYHHSSVEPGTSTGERNATSFFELFVPGLIANYMDQRWRYTGDEKDLRRYYPVIRECAEFFRHWLLIELPGNNLMTVPLIDVTESIYPVQDGPFTVCSAARLFDLVTRAARQLGTDADMLPVWDRYRDLSISLVRHIMKQGPQGKVFPVWTCYADLELENVPDPAWTADESIRAWRDAYRNANRGVDQFKTSGQNVAGDFEKPKNWPWGAFQSAYHAASLGMRDKTMTSLERAFRVLLPFCGQCESAEEDFSRIDHPWFTTASGALLRALGRMLLYPQDDRISLFPGVPQHWDTYAATLPAHGGLTVSARVENGKLVLLVLNTRRDQGARRVRIGIPRHLVPGKIEPAADVTILPDATSEREIILDVPAGWRGEIMATMRP